MTLPRWVGLAGVALTLGVALYVSHLKDALDAEKLERHNAEAAADTSHVVYHSATLKVAQRLAFQTTKALTLQGELKRALQHDGEQIETILRLNVALDSLHHVITMGQVTVGSDSTLRNLTAQLDTSGFHVHVFAQVPPPPAVARVQWDVRMDTIAITAAVLRDKDGRAIVRAAVPADATVTVDTTTVRTTISAGLSRTAKLARAVGLVVLGYALHELVGVFTKR